MQLGTSFFFEHFSLNSEIIIWLEPRNKILFFLKIPDIIITLSHEKTGEAANPIREAMTAR